MFQTLNNIFLYNFSILGGNSAVNHFVSSRNGGVSKDSYRSMNLSYATDDSSQNITINRNIIASSMGISPERLIFPMQTHSENILCITGAFLEQDEEVRKAQLEGVDALVTNVKKICISILTADCVPLLLFDPVKQVVASVHAGWRGTVKLIGAKTVQKMQLEFGSIPQDILVGIGPSIGPEAYEVGTEVIEEFTKVFQTRMAHILDDKNHVNLWQANRFQLLDCGIQETNIEIAGICTFKNDEVFYSSRKNKGVTGRFASGIMLL